jgi:hypothetical protein
MTLLFIIVIVIIISIVYFCCNTNELFTNKSDNKIIKYFGGDYCPHSNKDSRTYKLITEQFIQKYPNIKIEYYWTGIDSQEEFKKAEAQYVPTITNNNYEHVELKLPDNINFNDYNDDELEDLLLKNIYNQL